MGADGDTYDVAVIGGGPGGFGAAVAAGRMNRDVTLIEAQDRLGGAGTSALVNNFCNAYWTGDRFVIGGIFGELRNRLIGRKAIWTTRGPNTGDKFQGMGTPQEAYHPAEYADELDIMCHQADVDVRLETACTGAAFKNDHTHINLADDTELAARTVVDATGDAVLAHHAGVSTTMDEEVQPLTYCYMFGPIDLEALERELPEAVFYDENVGAHCAAPSYVDEVCDAVQADVRGGRLDIPVSTIYCTMSLPGKEEYLTTNFGHVKVEDPTDPDQLAAATEEGRRQMREGVQWLRENVPGFEEIAVVEEPRHIGVRESRQIDGLYTITAEDVIERRQFDDVIAQCCFNIDIHTMDTEGHDSGGGIEGGHVDEGEHYDIPWRSLVPAEGPENLVIAGRSISATSEAMASFRVSPSVMAIGEAAGVTAALAARDDVAVHEVDATEVQKRLRQTGATLT